VQRTQSEKFRSFDDRGEREELEGYGRRHVEGRGLRQQNRGTRSMQQRDEQAPDRLQPNRSRQMETNGDRMYPSQGQVEPEQPSEYADEDMRLLECVDCGRKFNEKALERHVKICKKVFIDKRKVFDSKKMRIEGVDPELKKILKEAEKKVKLCRL
jgi:hypothetical protein